jgi:hypothetical protein
MNRPAFARSLDDAHARLERDGAIELQLQSLDELFDAKPEAGAERLAGALVSARRLPDDVVLRVSVPRHTGDESVAEAALRDYYRTRAEATWQRVTTTRRTGMRQLAPSLLVAALAIAIATGCGTVAQTTATNVVAALLYIVAGVGVIAAWVIAWMPIEELLFDWRPDARLASAYDLLAQSRLEVVTPRPAADARRDPRHEPAEAHA